MGAVSALSTAFDVLRRNPVVFAATFLSALLGSLGFAGQVGTGFALPTLFGVVSFLVGPFIVGGVLGMVEEGLGGRTSLGTFLHEGRANYLSLLGGTVLYGLIVFVVGFVFAILGLILAITGGAALGAGGVADGVAGFGLGIGVLLFGLVTVVAIFVVIYFLQFFDTAVVVSDANATDCLQRSYRFVRANMLGALGFTVVWLAVSLVNAVPTFWLTLQSVAFSDPSAVQGTASLALPDLLPALALSLVLSTLLGAFLQAYKVAFYVGQSESTA